MVEERDKIVDKNPETGDHARVQENDSQTVSKWLAEPDG